MPGKDWKDRKVSSSVEFIFPAHYSSVTLHCLQNKVWTVVLPGRVSTSEFIKPSHLYPHYNLLYIHGPVKSDHIWSIWFYISELTLVHLCINDSAFLYPLRMLHISESKTLDFLWLHHLLCALSKLFFPRCASLSLLRWVTDPNSQRYLILKCDNEYMMISIIAQIESRWSPYSSSHSFIILTPDSITVWGSILPLYSVPTKTNNLLFVPFQGICIHQKPAQTSPCSGNHFGFFSLHWVCSSRNYHNT